MSDQQLLLFDVFGERQPTKGLGWAGSWLKMLADPEDKMGVWLKKRRELYANDQMVYMDKVHDCYRPIFRALPKQAGAVLWQLCRYYQPGTTFAELARNCLISVNVVSTQLHRMVKVGIIKRLNRGRYAVADIDMLRYYALNGDARFAQWHRNNRHTDPATLVDRFMEEMSCKNSTTTS